MSLMQSIVETVARFLPGKERDPLIDRGTLIGQPVDRVDGHVKVKGEARFTAEFKISNLAHAVLVHTTIAKGAASKTAPASTPCVLSAELTGRTTGFALKKFDEVCCLVKTELVGDGRHRQLCVRQQSLGF